jgi:streptogramin lyase
LVVEGLESRCLLAVTINEFPLPVANSLPGGITAGPDGNLWFCEERGVTDQIGQINPTTHAIAEYPTPTANSGAFSITTGPDGNLWFTESIGKIGQINPTTHVINEFPTASNGSGFVGPQGIAAGPDGNVWFTDYTPNEIGQINPTTHAITEFPVPTAHSALALITAGPDGNLWFTEGGGKIGQINPTTHAITEFPTPTANSGPLGITAGPDGNLWFTESTVNKIGVINPTTHAITEFPIPTANSSLFEITTGPDGNLWFTELHGNKIGEINPTTHAITEYPVPTASSAPLGITLGPDHNIWFTEQSGNKIGQVVIPTALVATTTTLTPSSVTITTNQSTQFTAVVTPNSGTGTPAGNVVFTLDGTPQSPVPLQVVNGVAQAVLPVSGLSVGQHTLVAAYQGNATFAASPPSNTATITFNAVTVPPRVVALQRFGFHTQPTSLVLSFSQPLDPNPAQNVNNYQLVTLAHTRHGLVAGRRISVPQALYLPETTQVELFPAQRLNLHAVYQLTVVGTPPGGLTSAAGVPLDGVGNGVPGSNYVALVTKDSLAGPASASGSNAAQVRGRAPLVRPIPHFGAMRRFHSGP